jgi:hypothetical protein
MAIKLLAGAVLPRTPFYRLSMAGQEEEINRAGTETTCCFESDSEFANPGFLF